MTFDSRNATLAVDIQDDWEPEVQAQWRANQSSVRMQLVAELGTVDGEAKIANFMALGDAPFSVIFSHNELLTQVRAAFAHGSFYPALVGACALGERLLNELITVLRNDFRDHPATTDRIRRSRAITNWPDAIMALAAWQVLSEPSAEAFRELAQLRHRSVHYDDTVDVHDRGLALRAIRLVQTLVEQVFAPMGGPPTYIPGTPGMSFIARAAESLPLVQRVFLPRCALVSPAHRMYPQQTAGRTWTWQIVDDADYPDTPLSDAEFAETLPSGIASMHTKLG